MRAILWRLVGAAVVAAVAGAVAPKGTYPMTQQQFIYVLRPARPEMITEGFTPEEAATQARHVAYLKDLAARGRVVICGRTTGGEVFGICVFTAASEADAREFMANDPGVREELMRAELFPFAASWVSEVVRGTWNAAPGR
jgi:uncharacterized protein